MCMTLCYNERRPVKGYEGLYEVSHGGDVYRVARGPGTRPGWKLKPSIGGRGYLAVRLYRNGIRETLTIHRIYADAWIPNPYHHKYVNHINGIKTDNRMENLEWCPKSHDVKHAHRVLNRKFGFIKGQPSLRKGKPRPEGSGTPPRPVRGTHKRTGEVREFESIREAARQVGGRNADICEACQGKRKSSAGYRWEYL